MDLLDLEEKAPDIKPRNPLIACLLGFFIFGWGYLYVGKVKKGAIFFSAYVLLTFIWVEMRWVTYFSGMVSLVGLTWGMIIYQMIDMVKISKRSRDYHLQPYNRWYIYVGISIVLSLPRFFFSGDQLYGIGEGMFPTPSMQPVIEPGDRLVYDTRAYDDQLPDYGDLVAFTDTLGTVRIYRLVALPGDRIRIQNNLIYLNGQRLKYESMGYVGDEGGWKQELSWEHLPNSHMYQILRNAEGGFSPYMHRYELKLGPQMYYLMGDNRDQAADCRVIGAVHLSSIKGKLAFSYWGESFDRVNVDFRNK